ncbi:hypothetical protein CD351_15300 [Erythrobacter sp. KY5]|uniref:NepR family anti-sigma factor n=1 Tax=Erythrobacter sp. KY5 TaxID=2011159 RepID=UPI000DBF3211|nr:NepR family anti-sigma factor [Erythrobacter sp. KY5]AWW75796.1 hypothetical protein CD351_15300 [Erythrobacter sp. KY5]
MATEKKPETDRSPDKGDEANDKETEAPAWADGLKELYDSVVDEPLPDSFLDLLEQFDKTPGETADDEGSADTADKSN